MLKITQAPTSVSLEDKDVLIFAEKGKLSGNLGDIPKSFQPSVKTILERHQKELGNVVEIIHSQVNSLILTQILSHPGLDSLESWRWAGVRAFEAANQNGLANPVVYLNGLNSSQCQAVLEGILLESYQFSKYRSTKKKLKVQSVAILSELGEKELKTIIAKVLHLNKGIFFCRDLIHEPGSSLIPSEFASRLKDACKNNGLSFSLKNENQLKSEGYQGLLTVGKGSSHPPAMVVLQNKPKKTQSKMHLVLVGKGITFDTGGISLKPPSAMWEMKGDMGGAATVCGAMMAIAEMNLPVKVSAVLCLAENRPGNNSVLPGDVFTAANGKTIMVDNTDAEGRLVLTDGLYEAKKLKATHVVDLATLTGSIIRALGPAIAGLFSNSDQLAGLLSQAGEKTGEKLWRLPLEMEYREQLNDQIADMKNIGKPEAGAITAGLFLQEFAPPDTPWAHLDIAGTAFTTVPWKYIKPGPTGWGVKTLVELAQNL